MQLMLIIFFRILSHCNTNPLLKARNHLNFASMQFRPVNNTGTWGNFCCSCCYRSSLAIQSNSFSNCKNSTTRIVVVPLQNGVKTLSITLFFTYTSKFISTPSLELHDKKVLVGNNCYIVESCKA